MYSDNDYAGAKSALKKFIIYYSLFALVMLGAIAAALVLRMAWLLYSATTVLVLVSLFAWGNMGIRLMAWNRFLRDMQKGLEREAVGVLASVEEDESLKEGLDFRAVRLFTGEESDKAGGRLLYLDATRFPIKADIGQKISCTLYGNYIKEIKILGDN